MSVSSVKIVYVCRSCGHRSPKWLGRCPGCEEWNTLSEEGVRQGSGARSGSDTHVLPYSEIGIEDSPRIHTGNVEFDRVLGGGIVPGSLVLIGGEPGVGKSTLLLQIADSLSLDGKSILYVAGEESARQIRLRGDRLGIRGDRLYLAAETCLEKVLAECDRRRPSALIVDSIQTVYSERLEAVPGSISQVRECAGRLLNLAKEEGVCVFLIGHITKDGALAGPKALEHIVDTVLYFEGERHQNQKIVRAFKNRFGPSNELGIFEMTGRGLVCVENPSRLFLSERPERTSGSCVVCTLIGSRPVLVEVQALVSRTNYGTARRMANGVDPNRLSLLLAMLEKRLGLQLLGSDVYVNAAGGLTLNEPAVDLAMVAAVVSSFENRPLPAATVVFGEVGLAGEVRAVNGAEVRVREAESLGFRRVLMPAGNLPPPRPPERARLTGVSSVRRFLEALRDSPRDRPHPPDRRPERSGKASSRKGFGTGDPELC